MRNFSASIYKGTLVFRKSNIELLRIIAMLMIIAHHISVHGGFTFSTDQLTVNRLWIQFIQMGGKIGVNIFVLITGYFLISETRFKPIKLITFWLQVFTYSIVLFGIAVLFGYASFGIKSLVKACFPITFSGWWYASTYFVLFLLFPYINTFLHTLNRAQYKIFLLILTVCWCIIPTVTGQTFQRNNLLWFVYLYAISGYIRIYLSEFKVNPTKCLCLSAICILLNFLVVIVFDYLGTTIRLFATHSTIFYGMQKLPIFVISILLFIGFMNINMPNKSAINAISSATFGVYLIHDNGYVRDYLYQNLFKQALYADDWFLIPYTIFMILSIFVICTVVELGRRYLLEKRYIGIVNKISSRLERLKVNLLSSDLFNKI